MMKSGASHQTVFGCLMVGTFCLFLSQCPSQTVVTLPAAQTPVLETILDIDNNAIAPFGPPGVFQMKPGQRIELRLRLPYPSNVGVGIENKRLTEVTDTASHPELDGFFHVQSIAAVDARDPLFFYRVLVVLPQAQRGAVNYALSIFDISQDQSLTGTQKEAPLVFTVFRMPNSIPQPSALLFQNGTPIPDQKHPRDGGDAAWIADNITLAGWLTATPTSAGATPPNSIEDVHYSLLLDDDFIERNYQATTSGLDSAIMPGRWFNEADNIINPKKRVPLTGGQPLNAGMLLLSGHGEEFTVEMNAWHRSKHNNQIPLGWLADPALSDVVWPFQVQTPFNFSPDPTCSPGGQPCTTLQMGDYVILNGALVQDSAHLHPDENKVNGVFVKDLVFWGHQCWEDHFRGQGGWLEVHPIDGLRRVPTGQSPMFPKRARMVQVCDNGDGNTPSFVNLRLPAEPDTPTGNRAQYAQLQFREIIDDRFTDMNTVNQHIVEVDHCDPTKLHVQVSVQPHGHFKAVYLLWWQDSQTVRPAATPPPCPPLNSGTPPPDDYPICAKKPDLPQCRDPGFDH